tara:strand:+ start:652 stop:1065 length:414 start_codon:yes stop_codon:yes gene_type:complete
MNLNKITSVKHDGFGGYQFVTVGGTNWTTPSDPKNKEYRLVQRWIAAGNTPTQSDEDAMSLGDYKKRAKIKQRQLGKSMFIDYRDELDTSDANALTYKTSMKNYFISDVKTSINAAVDRAGVDAAVALVDWDSVVIP